jgi:hypothetical protein
MPVEHFPIEGGHIMCFARACGDANAVFDYTGSDRDPVTVPAPLTFVQAGAQYDPDYPLRPRPGQTWPPAGTGGGLRLHAEQHYEYRRVVHAGDVLTPTVQPGRTWQKEGRRGGALTFTETVTEYLDASGEIAVIARGISVLTSRATG